MTEGKRGLLHCLFKIDRKLEARKRQCEKENKSKSRPFGQQKPIGGAEKAVRERKQVKITVFGAVEADRGNRKGSE